MTNPYDDPEQRPCVAYSICHNDDYPDDAGHRRVSIEVFQRPVGDYEIFAGGEPLEGDAGICESLAVARHVIKQLWGLCGVGSEGDATDGSGDVVAESPH